MIWQILRDKQAVVITENHGKLYYSWDTRKVGDYQFKLMKEQSLGMQKYYLALTARLTDMGLLNGGAMPDK